MEENTNDYLHACTTIQRQLYLLSLKYVEDEENSWPQMVGTDYRQSQTLFNILERWGYVVGVRSGVSLSVQGSQQRVQGKLLYYITPTGIEKINSIKKGSPLRQFIEPLEDNELCILRSVDKNIVFIVHGDDPKDDSSFVRTVANAIDSYGMESRILEPRPGEMLMDNVMEQIGECGAVVCIWDADREDPDSHSIRPNVLFESGIAIGILADSVLIIRRKPDLNTPSDYAGVVWLSEDEWPKKLPEALNTIRFSER